MEEGGPEKQDGLLGRIDLAAVLCQDKRPSLSLPEMHINADINRKESYAKTCPTRFKSVQQPLPTNWAGLETAAVHM